MTAHRPSLLLGEDLLPAPRQKRSHAKRAQLKQAALKSFFELGYERTSIEEIVSKTGLPTGTFYQHFRSKRQLLVVLMDELLEGMARLSLRPDYAGDARASLHELLLRAFSQDARYLGALRAWEEAVLLDAEIAASQAKIRRWTAGRVLALLQVLRRWPGARPRVKIEALAAILDGLFWGRLAESFFAGSLPLHAWVESATDLIYHALFVDP